MEIGERQQQSDPKNPVVTHPSVNPSQRTRVSFPGKKKRKNLKRIFSILIVLAVVVALVIIGQTMLSDEESITISPTDESTPTPSPTRPTATPTPEPINREGITFEVLNGTGIPGEAAYLQEKLEDMGYEDIKVGNASDQNRSDTEVVFSEDIQQEVKDEIIESLDVIYEDVDVSTSDTAEFDVQIIAGLRKGQDFPEDTPTPTPTSDTTPTPTPTGTEETPTPTP